MEQQNVGRSAESLRPKLGVSTCLLGFPVRYDGGHKRDPFLTDTFGQFVDWVPVCPEVECGMPTPRPSLRLVGDPKDPRLIITKTGEDKTEQMKSWAKTRLVELEKEDLVGYIFKSKSPSSGMERVSVYNEHGMGRKVGSGIFARAFMDHFPLLPAEEEGRLHDPGLRENFIERIFLLQRYREILKPRRSRGALVDFHTRHKYQLMAHSQAGMREMGRLVARAKELSLEELFARYEEMLLKTTRRPAGVKGHVNVLEHMLGYFKKQLSASEKAEMLGLIGDYRRGLLPLIVPVTLMKHYVHKYEEPYLVRQSYLDPAPAELKLRNHS